MKIFSNNLASVCLPSASTPHFFKGKSIPEEELYNSNKLGKTPTSKILDTFGGGIKHTIDVLEKGVIGTITAVAAGVVGAGYGVGVGGIYCAELVATPPVYAACAASWGVLVAGEAMFRSLTEPDYFIHGWIYEKSH